MRFVNRLAWATMVVGVTAAAGVAQQGSVISQGGQVVGGNLNTGGLGGLTTGGQGGGGGQGGLGGGGGQGQGTQLLTMERPPEIAPPAGTGGTANKSNVLGAWLANPYYQGTWDNSKSGAAPGGFGTALYPATGGTGAGGARGAGGRLGTQTGRQGGLGGLGTQRGGLNASVQSGTVVPMQVQIAYPAIPRFPTPPVAAPQLQADLSGMFTRASTTLPGAANVQVITNGNVVTLRGTVSDLDEARLIEGMTRLTPGVGLIRNELTFPVSRP